MLFLVVALFLICWFPLQLYNFLNVYKPEIDEYVENLFNSIFRNEIFIDINILLFYGYVRIG